MAENDILLETFIFENSQLLGQLENLLLSGEKRTALDAGQINETFRVMHTIKGSSAMMGYEAMAAPRARGGRPFFHDPRESARMIREWGEDIRHRFGYHRLFQGRDHRAAGRTGGPKEARTGCWRRLRRTRPCDRRRDGRSA